MEYTKLQTSRSSNMTSWLAVTLGSLLVLWTLVCVGNTLVWPTRAGTSEGPGNTFSRRRLQGTGTKGSGLLGNFVFNNMQLKPESLPEITQESLIHFEHETRPTLRFKMMTYNIWKPTSEAKKLSDVDMMDADVIKRHKTIVKVILEQSADIVLLQEVADDVLKIFLQPGLAENYTLLDFVPHGEDFWKKFRGDYDYVANGQAVFIKQKDGLLLPGYCKEHPNEDDHVTENGKHCTCGGAWMGWYDNEDDEKLAVTHEVIEWKQEQNEGEKDYNSTPIITLRAYGKKVAIANVHLQHSDKLHHLKGYKGGSKHLNFITKCIKDKQYADGRPVDAVIIAGDFNNHSVILPDGQCNNGTGTCKGKPADFPKLTKNNTGKCARCDGTGKKGTIRKRCRDCKGNGSIFAENQLVRTPTGTGIIVRDGVKGRKRKSFSVDLSASMSMDPTALTGTSRPMMEILTEIREIHEMKHLRRKYCKVCKKLWCGYVDVSEMFGNRNPTIAGEHFNGDFRLDHVIISNNIQCHNFTSPYYEMCLKPGKRLDVMSSKVKEHVGSDHLPLLTDLEFSLF